MLKFICNIIVCLVFIKLNYPLVQGKICLICNCVFVNISKVEPKPGDFVTFQYKAEIIEPFNENTTYESLQKFFYVDCSSENNVGQINNLDWPKLKVLGILANFRNSKWKKLESFPGVVKNQMTVLSLSQNLITEIEDFELDEFSNLKMLNLSENNIQIIKKGTFSKLNLLKIVDFSGNWLTKLEDWAFYGTDIQYLNLSRNGITHITPDVFRGLNNLTVLDVSDNRLTKLPDEFGNFLPSLMWLSVRKNGLQRLPELPKNLKNLDVSCNQLMDLHLAHLNLEFLDIRRNELVNLVHTNFPALKVLRVSYNNMTELSTIQSNQIQILDLSYNKFERIPDVVNSDRLPFLQQLYFDGNPIANVTFPPQSEPFSELKVLSLSHLKYVKKILKHSFQGIFPKVKYDCNREEGISVYLSHNSIKFIDVEAFKMISVCQIDLSNNQLKSLPKDFLPWRTMTYINLQDNPWQCDCNIQWMLDDFLIFMYENYPRLMFGMRCSTPLRYKNKMFVSWYNKSHNVFCNSGPSSFYLDLGGEKQIEALTMENCQGLKKTEVTDLKGSMVEEMNEGIQIWTASAITCVILGIVILITGIAIIILLCTRSSRKKRPALTRNSKGPPYYKQIQNQSDDKSKYSEKFV